MDENEARTNHPSRTGSPAASMAGLTEPEGCGHTDEEHETMAAKGPLSFVDLMAAITGERPVMIKDGYPYAVVQMIPHPEDERGYGLDISGGNVPNMETVAAILLDTVIQMNGLGEHERMLMDLADAGRVAKGLRPLTGHAFMDETDEEPAAEPEPAESKN